ncbi:RAQPRD family integrative conjugative element protein [Thiolapillus sp.]|uniref:integrative conjugative element protein, RAQPRD family n=1 Tax=Thiolapillus sp. TaxID=2017437 RepID=UPI003AF8F527
MKRPLLCAMAILASTLTGPVQADTEREYLMRLTQEIDALAPLIEAAEENADKSRRIRFRYDWLRRDLARIREGLLEHATADQAEPRRYPPLRGDYRR